MYGLLYRLIPRITLDDVEPGMVANAGQAGLGVHKIIQHGDAVARMQEHRRHHRA